MRHRDEFMGRVDDSRQNTGAGAGPDGAAARRAARFQRVREAHQSELAEDYVELIAELIELTGEARAVDLAKNLGVTQATVNNAIARLQRDGLVTTAPYRAIFLTESGAALAECSRQRHETVRRVLMALGVDEETADADAEGIEHHVSARTLAAFEAFLREQP